MNLSLSIAILDENLKGPTATFDEMGLCAVRSAWECVKLSLPASAPAAGVEEAEWVRVPREPTDEMIEAGEEALKIGREWGRRPCAAEAYAAMLSALPVSVGGDGSSCTDLSAHVATQSSATATESGGLSGDGGLYPEVEGPLRSHMHYINAALSTYHGSEAHGDVAKAWGAITDTLRQQRAEMAFMRAKLSREAPQKKPEGEGS